jgi:hypothetical protein
MFSLTEWIMKGAVWPRAAAFRVLWLQDGTAELRAGEEECEGVMTAFPIYHIVEGDGVTFHPEYGVPVYRLKSPQAGGAQVLPSRVHRA